MRCKMPNEAINTDSQEQGYFVALLLAASNGGH